MSMQEQIQRLHRAAITLAKEAAQLRDMLDEQKQRTDAHKVTPVWLNKTQAAKYAGVSTRTITRWESDGRIAFTTGRIHRRDLDTFLMNNKKRGNHASR